MQSLLFCSGENQLHSHAIQVFIVSWPYKVASKNFSSSCPHQKMPKNNVNQNEARKAAKADKARFSLCLLLLHFCLHCIARWLEDQCKEIERCHGECKTREVYKVIRISSTEMATLTESCVKDERGNEQDWYRLVCQKFPQFHQCHWNALSSELRSVVTK